MLKKDFLKCMTKTKQDLLTRRWRAYVCFALETGFGSGSVTTLYKSIINGRDRLDYGMFGEAHRGTNTHTRLISLEIFERVVIDEKLYKEL